ncbi:hypothetical protein [Natronosalvus halobius]|uniref:hypothetical protein n=1 Tax=Natronosalvus halobius TaxID=2953746 RepID=UPI0020A0CDDD|nr:hypothetical protein [Natronosalvus halobius]USZ73312.1 hypothetical protein NGM15_08445 [Natronosalvus halobius]
MYRRKLLAGVGSGLGTLVAGCLGNIPTADGTSNDNDETEDETVITGTKFETNVNVPAEATDSPSVSYEREAGEIYVQGQYSIGSACYEATYDDATYDAEEQELQFRVSRKHDGSDECEEIDQLITYRATITVDGPFPDAVVATESGTGWETTREQFE